MTTPRRHALSNPFLLRTDTFISHPNQNWVWMQLLGKTMSQLLHTDVIELHATNERQLEALPQAVHGFTKEINRK